MAQCPCAALTYPLHPRSQIQRGRPLHGRGRGRRSGSGYSATLALRAAPEALERKAADKVAARSSGREDLAEEAEESGLTVLRGATGNLINAAFLANTLGLHGTGGYAGAAAAAGAQREELAVEAEAAGHTVRRGVDGTLHGAGHAALALGHEGAGGYGGRAAGAALTAEVERAARRDEYAAYMAQHGISGALDAAGIASTALSLIDEPVLTV